ncbi:MAG: PH domain-containing protein [Halobacteriales archaeon]
MSDEWWFRRGEERVVWQGRPRLSAALGGIATGTATFALALGAAAVVDLRLAPAAVLGIGIVAWSVLKVRRTRYLLTTRALWLKRGVAGRTVQRVGLSKVQNTALGQSITGSAFGYGTVSIEVAGGRDLAFRRVDDPETVQTAISEHVGTGDDGIPGSVSRWRSVLRVVREIRATVE